MVDAEAERLKQELHSPLVVVLSLVFWRKEYPETTGSYLRYTKAPQGKRWCGRRIEQEGE